MSTQPNRLATGGHVDRARPLAFSFDGRRYEGFAGDTLASALLANGVSLVGRSFKYHRPRGILAAGPEEPNALVTLRGGARAEPNTKATTVELHEGLEARSQNRWPSLRLDLMAVNGLFAPLLAAGFYYKTFMWPAAFWERLYEPLIRRAAGLGRLSALPDPDAYEKAHAFCDVLVIGAGPAGLAAALAAGRTGARVILCEDDFVLGGRLNAERHEIDGAPAVDWARAAEAGLRGMAEVTAMPRTAVFGLYDGNTFGALERVSDHLPEPPPYLPRQRLWRIVARSAILAAGAVERPIVFGGNDLPGVMLAGAVRAYVNRFGVLPGRRAAVFTATDEGWRTAADLLSAGAEVAAVVDPRPAVDPAVRALAGDAPVHLGATVTDAHGFGRLRHVDIRHADGGVVPVPVDLLAVSGGHNPAIGLATHLGGRGEWSGAHAAFLPPKDLPPGLLVAGAAAGNWTLAAALADGTAAGRQAAESGGPGPVSAPPPRAPAEAAGVAPVFEVAGARRPAFVDLQNDVTAKDIAIAAREGFSSAEHLKRYTTLGMGTDQGRTSNVTGLAILARLTGRDIADTGATRFRPPQSPVAIGALAGPHAGRHFRPTRRTAGHDWAGEQGAVFVEAGQWLRAQWFPRPGEPDWLATVSREVAAVRGGVGVCDVSTLGKIALEGPDVGAFLDKVYCNTFSTLVVGRTRYGLMLREDGFVMDDGTVARLREGSWLMSTTTANAGRVMQHLEFCHQVLWPGLDLAMVSVTEQWAQYAVAGPRARDLLRNLFGDSLDLSDAAVPYLAALETALGEVPARLFRVSFSGELAYEIAVPARYGDALARALMRAGEPLGVVPYGTEALGVMRIEKGHVAGNEINGQTVARDLGLGRMMSKKKDFVGRVMAARPALTDPDRPALAGFLAADPARRLHAGAHFIAPGAAASAENDEGYMTSVAFSPELGRWIGLGLIRRGPERIGERVRAWDPVRAGDVEVEIAAPVFVDPQGDRLRG